MIEWYDELKNWLGGRDPIFTLLEYAGTFATAVSGIRLASIKSFDWFGAYVIGFVTALGGGTLRDAMLNVPPFWVREPSYLVCTFLALVSVWVFGRKFISEQVTWFLFDTIGLSIFTVIGLTKSLTLGFSWWVAIIMGTITGAAGGVMRDVLINEVPLIFRKEIYALACAVGGVAYFMIRKTGTDDRVCGVICVAVIFALRALAIKYHLGIPILSGREHLHLHHHRRQKVVDVVAALVRDGDRYLMAQRPQGKAQAGMWEFPGGKIEPGETVEQALSRECLEELDLLVENERVVGSVVHDYPDKTIRLTLVACDPKPGSRPRPLEHQTVGWFSRREMLDLPVCPADVALIQSFVSAVV